MFVRPCSRPPRWSPAPRRRGTAQTWPVPANGRSARQCRRRTTAMRCSTSSRTAFHVDHDADGLAAFPAHRAARRRGRGAARRHAAVLRPAPGGRRDLRAPDRQGAAPAVRDRAWFYLAKIRYQRGFLAEADDAVARIGGSAVARGRPAAAAVQPDDGAQRLRRRGSAARRRRQTKPAQPVRALQPRRRAGEERREVDKGVKLLEQIGLTPAPDEEMRALRDKANLALGFAALRPPNRTARQSLQRVRLQGMLSNKALLGFGWAAAELKDPAGAGALARTRAARRQRRRRAGSASRFPTPTPSWAPMARATEQYNAAIAAYGPRAPARESIAAIRSGHADRRPDRIQPGRGDGLVRSIRSCRRCRTPAT